MKRKKAFFAAVLSVLVLTGIIVAGGCWYSKQIGVKLEASTECLIDNVVCYYQKDSKWKEDPLGNSKYHMSDSGCLTCCLAAAINMQKIEIDGFDGDINPGTLNSFFSEHQVYDGEGNIQWAALESAISADVILKDVSELEDNEIQELLEANCFPVVLVKMPASGSPHFVLIVGSKDGEFLCMDPLNEELKLVPLSYFNGRIYSVRYIQN